MICLVRCQTEQSVKAARPRLAVGISIINFTLILMAILMLGLAGGLIDQLHVDAVILWLAHWAVQPVHNDGPVSYSSLGMVAMAVMLPATLHITDGAQARAVDFATIRRVSIEALPWLLEHWLPGGRVVGAEYIVRNPTRADRRPGSFKINIHTGAWADFATDERGADPIALHAYLTDQSQAAAALSIVRLLGVEDQTNAR